MWHPVCWSWVGKYWESRDNSSIHSSTDWVVMFLWRNVLVKTYLVQSEHVWKNIAFLLISFISPSPLLSESLPPSVSSWHVGSLPDHQPVSSDSLVWQSSSTKEAVQQTYTAQGFPSALSGLHPLQLVLRGCFKNKAFYWESMSAASYHWSLWCNKTTLQRIKPVTSFHSEYR